MKITYNPKHNLAYVAFKSKKEKVNTFKISEEVNIDVASDGSIYGIELLNANEQLVNTDKGMLTFVNSISGFTQELNLKSAAR